MLTEFTKIQRVQDISLMAVMWCKRSLIVGGGCVGVNALSLLGICAIELYTICCSPDNTNVLSSLG